MITKTNIEKAEQLLADAYASLAYMEYNCSGHINTKPLMSFRKAIRLLELNVNQHLPSELPKI